MAFLQRLPKITLKLVWARDQKARLGTSRTAWATYSRASLRGCMSALWCGVGGGLLDYRFLEPDPSQAEQPLYTNNCVPVNYRPNLYYVT